MWKARWSWYRMTHCHFARWKTLVVVPYDIFPCEIHWLCYRMAHWHVALVVVPYGALSCCTGCGTVWHIARLKALVVVPHSILPGERHWLWYRITYCEVKYTGCGTTWHIARLHFSWYRITHCQVKYTGRGTVWHIAKLHWSWFRMTHYQVKGTGRVTVWHNARWNTLVVVPYDTLSDARHWSWYHMTHCQVRGTGRGTVWHILTHDQGGNNTKSPQIQKL